MFDKERQFKQKKENKFFEVIKSGLEEAISHSQGKIQLQTYIIEIPEPITYKAKEIKIIRENNNCSQGLFAKVLNVSVKTVQSWESGDRTPNSTALRLLEIIDKGIYRPEIFKRN